MSQLLVVGARASNKESLAEQPKDSHQEVQLQVRTGRVLKATPLEHLLSMVARALKS